MPSLDVDDTIAAIASPPGESQRGILRVSGPAMIGCLSRSFISDDGRSLLDQTSVDAIPGHLQVCSETAELHLPGVLLIWPTNRSYTRQPSAEFHTVGSTPLLQMGLSAFLNAGARLAQPGEFTLRAFLSGRLDLTQAEAVLAVIDAKQQSDLRLSLAQLAGGLADPLTDIRKELMFILAELEAGLDFAEEDIEFISDDVLLSRLTAASAQLDQIADQIQQRHLADESITAVLTGLPNAGKSSLFNRLLEDSRAIVSGVAGTTTDYVIGKLTRDGVSVELIDTAGAEEISNIEFDQQTVRSAAQDQRSERIERAKIRVHCVAGTLPLSSIAHTELAAADLIVVTHADLPINADLRQAIDNRDWGFQPQSQATITTYTSATTGQGIADLRDLLLSLAAELRTADSPVVASTVLRTSDSLAAASQSVQLAKQAAVDRVGEELIASEIRQSLDHLGRVVGTIYTDDILDIVFGQFCIGK